MAHTFNLVPRINMQRSKFDLSWEHWTTFNAGKLVPVYCEEIYPGDSFTIDQTALIRLESALVTPVMDNLELKTEWFFVPTRLVWEHWINMMGEQEDPDDSIDFVNPAIKFPKWMIPNTASGQGVIPDGEQYPSDVLEGSILDYLRCVRRPPKSDLPMSGASSVYPHTYRRMDTGWIDILPIRAYWKIWQDWYKDENLDSSKQKQINAIKPDGYTVFDGFFGRGDWSWNADFVTDDGPNDNVWDITKNDFYKEIFSLAPRAKRADPFTRSLPWPQKGPGVQLSLTDQDYAPVVGKEYNGVGSISDGMMALQYSPSYGLGERGDAFLASGQGGSVGAMTNPFVVTTGSPFSAVNITSDPEKTTVFADLSGIGNVTINSLRTAFQLQKFYENLARSGSRYIEVIHSFFGVTSPDARLQRSEYLGGFSSPINFETIAQTSATDDTSPQGNLTAFGIGINNNHAFQRSFTEHGFVFCLASVVSKPSYSQGIHRMFNRRGRLDYYWPTFAHLGEQPILQREIAAFEEDVYDGVSHQTIKGDDVFGYQERNWELRQRYNDFSGQMAPGSSLPLSSWSISQFFESAPKLNSEFIRENPDIDRVLAVTSRAGSDQFILDIYFKVDAIRVMPLYGVPGLVDHF